MIGATIAALVMAGVATAIGGITTYYDSKAQAEQAEANGEAQAASARAHADEMTRQARLEEQRAGIEQIQGEQEAEKRSRQLAADIGATYANAAGNGILVDGNPRDTLGAALRTEVAEGQADISTIRDNTSLNVWTRQENARTAMLSASNYNAEGARALKLADQQADEYRRQGKLGLLQTVTGLPLTSRNGWGSATSSVGSMGSYYANKSKA